ncbi:NACHT domain-containing NTPase [Anabaena catenula FACHB-362]|uniref:NACHT domain-containing NTPase n=2 Tax=Anabaena TaxID=1163 RepID=A0ABR8IZF3_9NOST|nr:NACHT domain-containing NTPase [Anabaena catenula FACHB-362]
MRVLDMEQPIELTGERGIYTNVNILEKLNRNRRIEIAELLQNCNPEEFDRFGLSGIKEERVPGLEAVKRHSKLMVLGKPGAGKTTFLKYLAMHCIEGEFLTNKVPFFITMKEFAEKPKQPDLLEYLAQQLSVCNVKNAEDKIDKLLRQGRGLILLDGLDEVRQEDSKHILRQIREICNFIKNQFVITCRIAANDYIFQGFTDVEVADFDDEQIKFFTKQWFQNRKPDKIERFIQKIEDNQPIKELATNPLLLTLLCLIFEEKGKFKNTRYDLYEEGVELLLEKWDASRDIERDEIYKTLSTRRKEDLLSKIAITTFESGNYFFKENDAEILISEYIYNLLNFKTKQEILDIESKNVLKSIVSQHGLLLERAKGIYSFSHLTFHEYFAAREISDNSDWGILVAHITEKRWREVFLLTIERIKKADNLLYLMKLKTDKLLENDDKLQEFIHWVSKKESLVKSDFKPGIIRSFYFNLGLTSFNSIDAYYGYDTLNLLDSVDYFDIESVNQKKSFTGNLPDELILDLWLMLDFDPNLNFNLDYQLQQELELLTNKIPTLNRNQEWLYENDDWWTKQENVEWWQSHGYTWTEELRDTIIKYRNIGHDWQFSKSQKYILQKYYNANIFLLECLYSNCYVSREVRQYIENTLLLPMSEIETIKKQ